jgi:mycothiol synthase
VTTMAIELTARPLRGEEDLATIVAFHAACEAVDHLDDVVTLSDLRESLSEPGFDSASNVRLWFDQSQTLVGYTEFWPPRGAEAARLHPAAFLWFMVLPHTRGNGVEEQLIAWGQQRLEETSRTLGVALKLEAVARDKETQRQAFLEQSGFEAVRYFLRMSRPLAGDLPEPKLPPGMRFASAELSNEAYTELRNAVWVDHFAYQPWTPDDVAHYRASDTYDPQLDLAAIAEDGTPAGFCWCSIDPEEQASTGLKLGWIGLVGVRREFRGTGVGRALLREAMRRLKAAGVEFARLGVDGESPTGATKLYASEGFETIYARKLYTR